MYKLSYSWEDNPESTLSETEKAWNHFILSYLMFCAAISPKNRTLYEVPQTYDKYCNYLTERLIPTIPILKDKTLFSILENLKSDKNYELSPDERNYVLSIFNNYAAKKYTTRSTFFRSLFVIASFFLLSIGIIWCCCLSSHLFNTSLFILSASSLLFFLITGTPVLAEIKKKRDPRLFLNCFFPQGEFLRSMENEVSKLPNTEIQLEDNPYYQSLIKKSPTFKKIIAYLISGNYLQYKNGSLRKKNNSWTDDCVYGLIHDATLLQVEDVNCLRDDYAHLFKKDLNNISVKPINLAWNPLKKDLMKIVKQE